MEGKTKIRRSDNVEVIVGKDKGKRGEIVRVLKEKESVIVRGVNMMKKAMRPKSQQDRGGIIEVEAPIHISNVMIICKKCGKTRIGIEDKNGKKIRVCRKCGEAL